MGKNKENIEKSMIGREPISDELEKCPLKRFQVVLFTSKHEVIEMMKRSSMHCNICRIINDIDMKVFK